MGLAGLTAAAGCGERFSGSGSGGSGGAGGDSSQTSAGGKTSSSNTGGGDNTSSSRASTGVGGGDCVAEVCNGEDDNCDGTIDEGCPTNVVLTGQTFSGHGVYGFEEGPPFSDECLPGSAIYRLTGHEDDSLIPPPVERIQAHCAMLELVTNTEQDIYEYAVERGDPLPPLMSHGTGFGQPFELSCPGDEFMIGLSGYDDPIYGLSQLRVHCAELVFHPDSGTFTIAHSGAISIVGPPATVPEDFIDVLPSPKVVDRIRGSAGMLVNSLGIGEATPFVITP